MTRIGDCGRDKNERKKKGKKEMRRIGFCGRDKSERKEKGKKEMTRIVCVCDGHYIG
jgi:hypothetical protein